MINLAISGAAGRMGQALIRLAEDHSGLKVTQAIEHAANNSIGSDAGEVAGVGAIGVVITGEADPSKFDVMIEFTLPEPTVEHAEFCAGTGKAMMIGTTGMTGQQKARVRQAAEKIPLVLAANTSVGVNLCVALLETASRVIGDVTDIEIIEAHHRHKVDAPSGTALLLGEAVARPLGKSLGVDGVYSRHGHTGERKAGSIGFSAIRGGDIAGEHTVMFIGDSERIEITHRATDRRIFARGALRAAEWVAGKAPGFYDMQDVLELR